MYSSIEDEQQAAVIENCYWPLLHLTNFGIPIGLEASGSTLKLINDIDPHWLDTLSTLIKEEKIEFIGSGYSQIIGPLVPAKVNDWNQKIGQEVYKRLLGTKPKTALVNEMAFSAGIVEHYSTNGYDAIIMEWNNPRFGHPEWKNDWRYYPQKAKGCNNQIISLIWADSIAFQKFQRYTHSEISLSDYVQYVNSNAGDVDRFFPLYSNDVEIFNYRPGRYHTESNIQNHSEWIRILKLYNYLSKQDWCEFVFPYNVMEGLRIPYKDRHLSLESLAQPIPVKKQEKYNINRWALTGRDDLGINTKCYQIYDAFIKDGNDNKDDWEDLCYFWSSDFRTHITENRWDEYVVKLNEFGDKWPNKSVVDTEEATNSGGQFINLETPNTITADNSRLRIIFNKNKGLTIKEFIVKGLIEKPLFGTLDHGYYDDISLGADYFSGHAVIDRPGEHKVTDLKKVQPEIYQANDNVSLMSQQKCGDYTFQNNIIIDAESIIIEKLIKNSSAKKSTIHPFNITFNPEAWDRESLYVKTHDGGNTLIIFYLEGQHIAHGDIYSSIISARHGFGNTEGLFIVGDKDKSLVFECDMTVSALIPSIIYREMNDTYFFRLQYSAREIDETLKLDTVPRIIQSFIKIIAN